MKKISKILVSSCLCLSLFSANPSYADAVEITDTVSLEDSLNEYYIDEEGMIVAELLSDEELIKIEHMTPENRAGLAGAAVEYALSKIGHPYSNARRHSGSAYDCSSLIYHAYLNAGIDLSHNGMDTAAALANKLVSSGHEISSDNLLPGDLIFYSYKKNGRYNNISHVSIYIGDGLQVEASFSKKKVDVREVSLSQAVNICRPEL